MFLTGMTIPYQWKPLKESNIVAVAQFGNQEDYGWRMKEGILQSVYFTGISATELLDSLVCNCRDGCTRSCTCKDSHMPCIELWACGGDCTNPFQGDEDEDWYIHLAIQLLDIWLRHYMTCIYIARVILVSFTFSVMSDFVWLGNYRDGCIYNYKLYICYLKIGYVHRYGLVFFM